MPSPARMRKELQYLDALLRDPHLAFAKSIRMTMRHAPFAQDGEVYAFCSLSGRFLVMRLIETRPTDQATVRTQEDQGGLILRHPGCSPEYAFLYQARRSRSEVCVLHALSMGLPRIAHRQRAIYTVAIPEGVSESLILDTTLTCCT